MLLSCSISTFIFNNLVYFSSSYKQTTCLSKPVAVQLTVTNSLTVNCCMVMDSSIAQSHHQEMVSQTLESMLVCTKPQQEKKPRPTEQAQKCPRCDSSNTKFCYYNNYSLSQPRFFCKSCRRYWTKGGTLRNVPVGGGCRKAKRSSSSSSSSSSKRSQDHHHHQPMTTMPSPNIPCFNPRLSYDSNDYFSSMSSGNPSMGLGDFGPNSSTGLFDALRGGNLENQRGFHNLYYGGMGNGIGIGNDQNGGMGISGSQEMGLMGFEGTTTVKQEMSNGGRDQGESSRGLWGFPWQSIGGDGNMGDLDSGRGWNAIGSSNWHGLLNSPLM